MPSLIRRVLAGLLAGLLGTAAMDLVWYRRYRKGGGSDNPLAWEFATSTASFEEASAPGQVGQRLASAVGVELPDHSAGTTTNVMHWLTGAGYGLSHGLVQHDRDVVVGGAATGLTGFANSYLTLGAMGIYEPIWRYDSQTLAKDLSAHLVFGLVTSLAYRALARPNR